MIKHFPKELPIELRQKAWNFTKTALEHLGQLQEDLDSGDLETAKLALRSAIITAKHTQTCIEGFDPDAMQHVIDLGNLKQLVTRMDQGEIVTNQEHIFNYGFPNKEEHNCGLMIEVDRPNKEQLFLMVYPNHRIEDENGKNYEMEVNDFGGKIYEPQNPEKIIWSWES